MNFLPGASAKNDERAGRTPAETDGETGPPNLGQSKLLGIKFAGEIRPAPLRSARLAESGLIGAPETRTLSPNHFITNHFTISRRFEFCFPLTPRTKSHTKPTCN